jgi:hypothetical protein
MTFAPTILPHGQERGAMWTAESMSDERSIATAYGRQWAKEEAR